MFIRGACGGWLIIRLENSSYRGKVGRSYKGRGGFC